MAWPCSKLPDLRSRDRGSRFRILAAATIHRS